MPVTVPEYSEEQGKKDARRHRQKQKEAIKSKLPEIIAEESIITGRKGKIVKVPIRSIEIPEFKPNKGEKGGGIGQGSGKPGDIIGRNPAPQEGIGGAGQEPGVDYIETEIEIEEIIEMMLEDLGLPKLEEKNVRQILVELGYKIKGRAKDGPWVLLDKRATAKEGIKRFWIYLRHLQAETGRDEQTCYSALKQSEGNIKDALELLKDPAFCVKEDEEIEPFCVIGQDDLRFYKFEKDIKPQSQAVVIAMMDVSGSMGTDQKYLARSMLFWLVEFLRKIYKKLDVRFIVHTAEAHLVDEDKFFHMKESGGTKCWTAYELAKNLVESEYSVNEWNVYMFHFSDGDDWGSESEQKSIELVRQCIDLGINMFGYGQVPSAYGSGHLMEAMGKELPVELAQEDDCLMLVGSDDFPFLAVNIDKKEHLLPALKTFLKKDRWKPEVAR